MEPRQKNWSQAKRTRFEALKRERRVIFNDDTGALQAEEAHTAEGFLAQRLKPLIHTHVDTLSWSVLGTAGDAPAYASKIQPTYSDAHGGPPTNRAIMARNLRTLIESGNCPFQTVIDFAHSNDFEAWAHVRMNDVHDSFKLGNQTIWKKRHPQFLVNTEDMLPDRTLYITSQDFSHEEVRQRKLEIFEELCERYDLDGFEIDYIRHPVLFSRSMQGKPVTVEEIELMTSFMDQIRTLADAAASKRKRPILFAARVPDSFQLSLNVGLDVRRWIMDDIIDIVIIGGGYMPFALSISEFVDFSHQHGVLVYPCMNVGAFTEETLYVERALAAKWYQSGADGMYLWNLATCFEFMTGQDVTDCRREAYACTTELGDPAKLTDKDKLYRLDVPAYLPYQFISSPPSLPIVLRSNVHKRLFVEIADDVQSQMKAGMLEKVQLRLTLKGCTEKDAPALRINEQAIDGTVSSTFGTESTGAKFEITLPAPPLKMGLNTIDATITNSEGAPSAGVQLTELKIFIKYR